MHYDQATTKTIRTSAPMRIEALQAHSVSSDVLAIWRETVGPELLPVQARAVRECGLLSGRDNLIVFSPTSSGKTFVGEMAAVKAAREGTKVFYLVPQKALADEKFRELRDRYQRVGLEVVVSSSDHREHDEAIGRGAFDVAVVVFEKLQVLLVRRPELIHTIGLVVIDELQLITDKDRGPDLELLLTKLLVAPNRPRLIGLSAVLGGAEHLAQWLGARLLVDTHRPVELRKGVLCRGEFRYIEHNSHAEGTEVFADVRSLDRNELMLAAAEELAKRGEQVLMFVPDRLATVKLARKLVPLLGLPPLDAAMAELGDEEETSCQRELRETLAGAVAFHNSDLSAEERRIVEHHFREGGIRVLVSTTTLAVGMNLPTKNVIIDGQRWRRVRPFPRPSLKDVTKAEYENMSGRAGRLAFGNDFGRSILVTSAPFRADSWMENFVGAEFEPVMPMLKDTPLEDHVLNLLTSGLAGGREELETLLLQSFTGVVHWSKALSRDEFATAVTAAIEACTAGGLVRDEDGLLVVTEVGKACASKGIHVKTGCALARWAELARKREVLPLEILVRIGRTTAGDEVHVPLSRDEKFDIDYRALLFARIRLDQVADRGLFDWIANPKIAIEYDDAKAVKKALVLSQWLTEVPTPTIEQTFPLSGGMIRRIAGDYSWLVEGLGAIAAASGWPKERCRVFEIVAERLVHGVRADALPLARMRVLSLRRAHLRRLVAAGFGTEEVLKPAAPATIRALIDHDVAFVRLAKHLGWQLDVQVEEVEAVDAYPDFDFEQPADEADRHEEPSMAEVVEPAAPDDVDAPASVVVEEPATVEPVACEPATVPDEDPLVLDADLVGHTLVYRGVQIRTKPPNNLQRQQFVALACLALHPGKLVRMTELAKLMDEQGGLRQAKVADARELRYRILRALKMHFPEEQHLELEALIEMVRGEGLRLCVSGRVRVVLKPARAAPVSAAPARRRSPKKTKPRSSRAA